MAKVEGSYESVVRGVSQQVPHQRFSGQHSEQVNLLSDPVEGLVRRRGTRRLSETAMATSLSPAVISELQKYRTHKWNPGASGDPLQVAYKKKGPLQTNAQLLYAMNQNTRAVVPVNVLDGAGDTVYQAALNNGISAITSVGRYLFMAANNNVGSVTATQDYLSTANRNKVVAWIRGGAYARTFTVTLLLDAGGSLKFWYTTMASSYPTPIDTAAAGTPGSTDYQDKLSKIVADYNSATTKWIGDAARDIQPDNIAIRLVNGPASSGNTGSGTSLLAAQAANTGINKVTNLKWSIVGSTVYIQGDNIREIVVDDAGDTTLIRGVGSEISSADLVSVRHWYGKIIKVRATKSDDSDAYYLQAGNKNDSNDPAAYDPGSDVSAPKAVNSSPTAIDSTIRGEVVWKESAGYTQTLENHFLFGYYHTDGEIYVTSDLSLLASTLSIITPTVQPNLCGDDYTNPPPNFATKQITYLGVFQDRLVVGSGAVTSFSRPGDYLNFFRQSVLTLVDTDPIDMFALGAEDDVLRHSALFDKSLFVFGDKRQYVINGRTVLTPTNQNITVVSQFPNTTGAQPQGSGNFIFYTKPGDTTQPVITLNQMQYGQIADSTESYDLSQQLTDFCSGVAAEITPITSPTAIIIRPETSQNLYIFRYTDEVGTGRRLQAAWDRWLFDSAYGTIISLATNNDEILAMVMRRSEAGVTYLAMEQMSLRPAKSEEAYHDSYQTVTGVGNAAAFPSPYINGSPNLRDRCYITVVGGTHPLTGAVYTNRSELTADQIDGGTLVGGIPFVSKVTLTNPYQRDAQGNAILYGRLTLTQLNMSVQETAAMNIYVKDANREWLTKYFNGFLLSRVASQIGSQPVINTQISALVGREVRECECRVESIDWYPLNITAISWTGQVFRR